MPVNRQALYACLRGKMRTGRLVSPIPQRKVGLLVSGAGELSSPNHILNTSIPQLQMLTFSCYYITRYG